MSKSSYEYYKEKKHLEAEKRRENLNQAILDVVKPIYSKSKKTYGFRRIILSIDDKTKSKLGVGRDKIRKVLRENNLFGIQGKSNKYRSYKGDNGMKKENLLLKEVYDQKTQKCRLVRDFSTTFMNEKWVTDVSEFKIKYGKLYLSPILDLNDDSIVSFDISTSPNMDQVYRMLKIAFRKYNNLKGLILHSDQGYQYQNKGYIKLLKEKGIRQSFSRKGNCLDNSRMENFFGLMKNEMFYGHEKEFKSLDDLRKAMEDYISYYNNERISLKRMGLSPNQYRQKSQAVL